MIEFAPRSEHRMTYDQAVVNALACSYNNHKDWRLPSIAEWSNYGISAVCWFDDRSYFMDNFHLIPVRTL